MERVVLLDTSAIIYRAFYANPHFRTKKEPTGAIYGFTLILQKIIKEFSPKMIGAAFDVSRSTLKRTESYSEYKAQREAAPEDLIAQIPRIEELLDYYGIAKFKIPGHEADDVLGTLAKQLSEQGYEVIIITGDKDISQLICDEKNIKIALLGKGDGKDPFKILEKNEDVVESLGVLPCQIPDFFGLIGDSSDGIPGVRKIGPKKAIPMIEKYENLEGIYENIEFLTEIPGIGKSLIQNMIEDKELAFLSRKLATIEVDLEEIKVTGEELVFSENKEKLREFFTELEFKAMIKKYDESSSPSLFKTEEKSEEKSEDLKENLDDKQIFINYDKYKKIVVDNEEIYELLKSEIDREKKIVFYLDEIGCSVSTSKTDFYIPNVKKSDDVVESPKIGNLSLLTLDFTSDNNKEKEWFVNLFENEYEVVGFNLKTLCHYTKSELVNEKSFDMLIAYHLLTSSTKDEIELFAKEYTGVEFEKFNQLYSKRAVSELSAEEIIKYITPRSRVIYETEEYLRKRIEHEELEIVLNTIEMPLISVLAQMERDGIKIDIEHFRKLSKEFNYKLDEIREQIYLEAGAGEKKEFNINSPKQLAEILFVDLGMPILKKNKTGPSTDVEVLENLRDLGFKVAELLLEHRKLSKLTQTYVDPLPKLVDINSRIHSSFNQIGTATGRLSSSNPNLQNIPVKSDEGLRIREGFVADKEKKLIGIDYSQIELRVLAEMTQDENLILAYRENKDLHEITARKIFGVNESEAVTREQRTIAKTINFSLIYGKTAFGLAKELKIPQKDASTYIKTYFEQYPKVKVFEQETIEYAEKHGYVKTLFGRKRGIEGINSRNRNIKMQGERMAVNTVIQGTAAEIIKKAMIDIYNEIKEKTDIKLILQVHDELIFEVDEKKAETYKKQLEEFMKKCVEFKYSKLDVNGSIASNWGETK
ncbi:MAG: DNA polymerase I [Fusobacteriaceae bacterium]|nr:DNA polymerase I [Fusobacteriaceae bacterium]